MNRQQPVPTLEQRRALAAYLENQRQAEIRAGWNEYMREQTYRAERGALRVDPATFVQRTVRQVLKDELKAWRQLLAQECREHPAAFLAVGLIWAVALGIGLVAVAVRNGWIQ